MSMIGFPRFLSVPTPVCGPLGEASLESRFRSVAAWSYSARGERVGEWVGLVAQEHVWTRAQLAHTKMPGL
jgi:hypothetical protein